MNNTLTPHKHAALLLEWAQHVASGAVYAGWYACESISATETNWHSIKNPSFHTYLQYRIVMTENHPDYKPPPKMIVLELELTDEEIERLLITPYNNDVGLATHWKKLNTALNKALKESK